MGVAQTVSYPQEVSINFIQHNALKSVEKASAVGRLRLNTLRSIKTTFLTTKRCDKHPNPLIFKCEYPTSGQVRVDW